MFFYFYFFYIRICIVKCLNDCDEFSLIHGEKYQSGLHICKIWMYLKHCDICCGEAYCISLK